jgi:predicted N-acyltransferase
LTLGRELGYCQSHGLICYSPFSLRSKILLKKDPQGKLFLNQISNKIDDICREKRILFSSFLFVSESDEILINNLNNLGYSRFDGTTTFYLDVQWSSFEDYLKSLKQMNRHSIRREIRKCAENGITIKETDLKDLSKEMSVLVSNLISKYNKNSDNPFDIGFFSKLDQYARDKIKLFIAEKNGDIIGFSLCLRQRNALDVWMCGFNYEVQTNTDFTYFNLCYYAPIRWAIENGYKKIYYRRKSERAKLYRGCKLETTYSFVKCHDAVLSFWINKVLRNSIYSPKLKQFSNAHKIINRI